LRGQNAANLGDRWRSPAAGPVRDPMILDVGKMKTARLLMVAAIVAMGAAQGHAGDLTAGQKVYQASCKSCHGPKARGMASFPKLTGQTEEYLANRLQQYRAGESVGPNSALMKPVAAKLTDEDIANVAAFVAQSLN
jgi:cytochrome c553